MKEQASEFLLRRTKPFPANDNIAQLMADFAQQAVRDRVGEIARELREGSCGKLGWLWEIVERLESEGETK